MPEISVLMGIYNCAETLEEAVECIKNQSFESWELILCDDCSTDNTYEVAEQIAKSDSRIRLLRNEKNLTLAPTLNRCAKVATGKYMARMDGDDICDVTRFEKEYAFLESHSEFALVSCNMVLFDSEGEFGTVHYTQEPPAELLLSGSQFCHAGCMMRMDVFRELRGYGESKDVERIEDYDLWFRLYDAGYKGYNISEALYSMRDDRHAFKRRNMSNRLNEYKLLKRIYKRFPVKGQKWKIYVPIIKGLMPSAIYKMLHKRKANRKKAA